MHDSQKVKRRSLQDEILDELHITQADLEANRRGRLTQRQIENVQANSKKSLYVPLVCGIFIAATMLYLFGERVLTEPLFFTGSQAPNPAMGLALLVGSVLIAFLPFLITLRTHLMLRRDCEAGKISRLQGPVIVHLSTSGYDPAMTQHARGYLEIQGFNLPTTYAVLKRVKHLEPYNVYVLPDSKRLLSLEPLSETDNLSE